MMQKYLPTNDLLFKKMLTSSDSSHILKAFVKDLLGIEFKTLKPKETYHIDSYKKAFEDMDVFRTEVDILAVAEDGSHCTIECQIQPHSYFCERSIFYLTEAFRSPFGNVESKEFIKDNNFSALRPAYGINIVDFHLFDKKDNALQVFRLLSDETHKPFLGTNNKELLILCFLSLKNKIIKPDSPAYPWQYFLKTGEVVHGAPDYIQAAKCKIDFLTLKEEEKTMIMKIDKTKAINDAVISTAREEGLAKGRKEQTYTFALKLLKEDFTIEKISDLTGLEIEEINRLRNEQE